MKFKNPFSDGIYNYFSRRNTPFLRFLLYIFSLEFIFTLLFFRKTIFEDQDLNYYFYSTIVQGFLALVAFLGAITIYKLQNIETELNNSRDRLIPQLIYFVGQKATEFSWIEAMNEAKKTIDNNENNSVERSKKKIERMNNNYNNLSKLNKEKGEIRSRMVDFSFLSFINIFFALMALPISNFFNGSDLYLLNFFILLINIFLSLISIVLAFKLIRATLGYSFKL